ncbi:AAA domain-containing protein [Nonomuraea sp. NPDC026600]|uniref:caspase, EACC1-associated type n=1 Tax=Nonomuraea sp. NPDC026600 TaxID=3155363 RepID=UPI00340453B2
MRPALTRRALLIGTETYRDGRFAALASSRADIWQLHQILEHRSIGAFKDVAVAADLTAEDMRYRIAEFLESCEYGDLALLYITGHGVRMSQSTGEFFFAAADTDYDRVPDTGVSAGFVNEQLESCVAPQKVVILDSCRSGGFTLGWRTRDPLHASTAKSAEPAPLTSRGVYIIASSGAGEDSFSGPDSPEGPQPSVFTGQLVEALRTGKAGRDGTGNVTVDDLFDHVNQRMRTLGLQIPVKSALAVNDRIVLARRPHGAAPTLKPVFRAQPAPKAGRASSAETPPEPPTWPGLLAYYSACVLSEQARLPLLAVADTGRSYVCLPGTERLVSGDLEDDGCVPAPKEIEPFLADDDGDESELWAGYPAVVLTGSRDGTVWRAPKFAPLIIRRVEAVTDGGSVRLRPYGSALPHPGLAAEWLGSEQAENLLVSYDEGWQGGQLDAMADEMGGLLRNDFELPSVQELRPDQLDDHIDVRSPGRGARNAAVLFRAQRDQGATKGLLDDFARLTSKLAKIGDTALAALMPSEIELTPSGTGLARMPRRTEADRPEPILVTPLSANEAQRAVLRSAMTRRLTAATGPPGTGKSQLVVNMIATAMAAGQRVLVASTNNQAVNEVWQRCEALLPDSLVRTGSRDYRQKEAATLQRLSVVALPPGSLETAGADLRLAAKARGAVRTELAATADVERALAVVGEEREEYASELGMTVPALTARLGTDAHLSRWKRLANRAARARVLGGWRRERFLRHFGLTTALDTAAACRALAAVADTERQWRNLRGRAGELKPDADLAADLDRVDRELRRSSAALWKWAVCAGAAQGRQAVHNLLQAAGQRSSDWPAVKAVLPYVRAWAVTSLSARRFPPEPALFDLVIIDEASQCSIPHIVPLLFRARRALIIGDVMQLPHIATIRPEQEAVIRREMALRADWLETHRLTYRRHSAFHAAEAAAGGSLLLDEHYRCHPDIAALSNRLFYGGALTILTDIRSRPSIERPAIVWVDAQGQARRSSSGESWINTDEADKVVDCVDYLLRRLPEEGTVGVVTPFKAHEGLLSSRLSSRHRVRVGTVHTFQGGECDAMVMSLVAGQGINQGAIDWIDRQPNLWNVAITRARSHLIVVGDRDRWTARGGVGASLIQAAADTAHRGSADEPDELTLRLYEHLRSVSTGSVELGTVVRGHRADACADGSGVTTAFLLDRGNPHGVAPDRHLELMLRKRDLLDPPADNGRTTRLAAWRLYDSAP